jgi:hypothetical protein
MNTVIINRHNYEEFFLLYIDDELESSQRSSVEKFLEENPDLAGELQVLQQATLPADSVRFSGKEFLYKQENGISISNYEEYFLLSIDNELNEEQQNEVEKFILQHPQLQSQFTLLQQTKLEPELIAFRDKKELYRSDKTRTIPIAWIRVSVAAAILGLAVAVWIFRQDNVTQDVATTKKPTKVTIEKIEQPIKQVPVAEQPVVELPIKEASGNEPKGVLPDAKKSPYATAPLKEIKIEKNVVVNKATLKEARDIVTSDKRSVKDETPAVNEQKYQEPAIAASDNNSSINKDAVNETQKQTSFVNHPDLKDEPALASHTLYREIEADEEDKTIYIGAAGINKNKLKGLFKKATGFLDKKIGRNINEKLLQ